MDNLTHALMLAWQASSIEASNTHHVFIEPVHLLIALYKMEAYSRVDQLKELGLTPQDANNICVETSALTELFARFQIDPVSGRRELREAAAAQVQARGREEDRVIHRSALSRQMFLRAAELAEKDSLPAVTTFHLLAALLAAPNLTGCQLLAGKTVDIEALRDAALKAAQEIFPAGEAQARRPSSGSLLALYGKDLTLLAEKGEIHQAIGRKKEMLQIVRTLSRETKNNPLLIGDPGVGKTAVVEGLAWRIAKGNVSQAVREKRIIQISLADIIAGTKYRGEFEEKLMNLIREVAASPEVILFLDEIHTVVRGGSVEGGALDAANIMKPALAQGELRCIGATTIEEYREYIEKDAAFERRFQPITIDEPSPEETLEILKGIQSRFAERHQASISEETLEAAVRLARRFLPDRRLPDKAIDLLDEACARAKITRLTISPDIPMTEIVEVTPDLVAEVISEWTSIPAAQLTEPERERLLKMGEILRKRVIGQDKAVDAVTEAVQRARAGIKDPNRPISVMLFMGPTGVGKTELAKATTEFLFGSDNSLIRLDMSEFMEKYSVSRLIGSPPGYVGYEEEGQLTGALRRKPFSVVLLDEVEKADPEVLNLFLQVFDDGRLTDAKGRTVDASNALFIMTSNIGFARGLGYHPFESHEHKNTLLKEIKSHFRPEFVNRIDEIIFFRSLEPNDLGRIAQRMLQALEQRLADQNLALEVRDNAIETLVNLGYDEQYGARSIQRVIGQQIENPLGGMILRGELKEGNAAVLDAAGGKLSILIKAVGGPSPTASR